MKKKGAVDTHFRLDSPRGMVPSDDPPHLTASPGGPAARAAARVPALRRYAPPAGLLAWAAGPHAQTLLGGE